MAASGLAPEQQAGSPRANRALWMPGRVAGTPSQPSGSEGGYEPLAGIAAGTCRGLVLMRTPSLALFDVQTSGAPSADTTTLRTVSVCIATDCGHHMRGLQRGVVARSHHDVGTAEAAASHGGAAVVAAAHCGGLVR